MAGLPELQRYSAGQTIQFGQAGQKQRTLADLGQYAAKGDYQNAAGAAFAGGQPDIGAAMAKMGAEKHQQIVQDAASLALNADTPEKWAAAGQQFQQAHPEIDWAPFQARNTVISQAQSVAEQMAQRNADRSFGLQQQQVGLAERTANRADAAAARTAAVGSIPTGYRANAAGTGVEPTPGGPSDPATMLTPEALDLVSTQYLAGDKSAISGYARNPMMRAAITNAVAEKANALGMDGKAVAAEISAYAGNVAGQRSAGTRAAQVGMAASEANQMADIALEASNKVPREALVPWNRATNAVRTGTSTPEMAAFVTATTSLVNAYARAISPLGAPTDAMRQHAEEMLNTAQGPDAYAAVIAQMKREMDAALNAPAEISSRLKEGVANGGVDTGTAPAGGGWTVETVQ